MPGAAAVLSRNTWRRSGHDGRISLRHFGPSPAHAHPSLGCRFTHRASPLLHNSEPLLAQNASKTEPCTRHAHEVCAQYSKNKHAEHEPPRTRHIVCAHNSKSKHAKHKVPHTWHGSSALIWPQDAVRAAAAAEAKASSAAAQRRHSSARACACMCVHLCTCVSAAPTFLWHQRTG